MKQISTKAYKDFNKRIFDAFKSINPCFIDGIGIVMGMIELFLAEKDVLLYLRNTQVKLVYTLILPELEKAAERSRKAREAAQRRREAKEARIANEEIKTKGAKKTIKAKETIKATETIETRDAKDAETANVASDAQKCSGVDDKVDRVGNETSHKDCAFNAGNSALLEKPAEQPEEQTCGNQHKEVKIGNPSERKRGDCGSDSKHEENIENIAADNIADSKTGLVLKRGSDRCGEIGERRAGGDNGKTDHRLADIKPSGYAGSTINKQVTAIHQRSQTTDNIQQRPPQW